MSRRTLDFHSTQEVTTDLDRLLANGYKKEGNWSLGQVCQHLAIFIGGSMDGFTAPRLPWYIRLLSPLFVRWVRKHRRMPAGTKVPPAFHPQATADDAAEVHHLKELLNRLDTYQGPWHQSPFGGQLDRAAWMDIHLIHCGHHLSFLNPQS